MTKPKKYPSLKRTPEQRRINALESELKLNKIVSDKIERDLQLIKLEKQRLELEIEINNSTIQMLKEMMLKLKNGKEF